MAKNITFILILFGCLAANNLSAQAGGSYSGPSSTTAVTPATDTIDSHGDNLPSGQPPREVGGTLKPGKSKNAPIGTDNQAPLLYPNPTTGLFFVENQDGSEVEVTVYSLSGLIIAHQRALERCTIDLSEQLTGIYLIQIKTSTGVRTQKLAYFK